MPPIKTLAIVANVQPYRESSALVSLLTRELGLVKGVAKGIRTMRKDGVWLERGETVEALVYGRGGQGLHTLGALAGVKSHQSTRTDLWKTAVRDAVLEAALRCIHESEPHPELYLLFDTILDALECGPAGAPSATGLLWVFYARFLDLLGFGINFETCLACGRPQAGGGNLAVDRGGLVCASCARPNLASTHIPAELVIALRSPDPAAAATRLLPVLPPAESHRITRILASCCLYHCEARAEFRSLAFLEELWKNGTAE